MMRMKTRALERSSWVCCCPSVRQLIFVWCGGLMVFVLLAAHPSTTKYCKKCDRHVVFGRACGCGCGCPSSTATICKSHSVSIILGHVIYCIWFSVLLDTSKPRRGIHPQASTRLLVPERGEHAQIQIFGQIAIFVSPDSLVSSRSHYFSVHENITCHQPCSTSRPFFSRLSWLEAKPRPSELLLAVSPKA